MEMIFCVLRILAHPKAKQRWGVKKYGMLQGRSGILFHVHGNRFVGWVKVMVDADSIRQDISFMSLDGKVVDDKKGVWIMELAKTIDEYVAGASDSSGQVLYREGVLKQVIA